MFADVYGHLFTLVVMRIHQDPLDEIVAVLVPCNVDEGDARSIWPRGSDDPKISIQEVQSANLEALLDNLGGKLVDAVVIRVRENVVDDTTLVRRRAVFAQVLNTPITKLAVGNKVNVGNDFFDRRALSSSAQFFYGRCVFYLFLLNTVLEDVLDNETASFT